MTHEYIVVGSGAGGGPVAANLAAAGHSVLLLEAGGDFDGLNYQVPAFHPGASEDPAMSWEFYPSHYGNLEQARRDPKFDEKEGGVFYPRAATLGGCTAHNALIFVSPATEDFDRIAEITGDDSWRAKKMRRHFKRLERCDYRRIQRFIQRIFGGNPSRHGFSGWLAASEADPEILFEDPELLRIIKRSAFRSLISFGELLRRLIGGIFTLLDPNDWRFVEWRGQGTRLIPVNIDRGERTSTRERVLAAQKEHDLEIRTHALVTRVLFDEREPTRAVGVEYLEGRHLYQADPNHGKGGGGEGTRRQAFASREVILAGGAFNSPQILQLSGIGPPELLAEHGIEVRVPLAGVGENLQDRYEVGVVVRLKKPFKMLEKATLRPPEPGQQPDPVFVQWRDHRTGLYATNGGAISIIKRSDSRPSSLPPDLYIFAFPTDFQGYFNGYSKKIQAAKDYFTWAILKGHTVNQAGTVRIRSADPTERPDIDFRYFEEGSDAAGEDLDAVVGAVQFIQRLQRSYRHLIAEHVAPGPEVESREQIAQWVRDVAWGHHASCTCKIGADDDPTAVLDSRLRVRGTTGLRVVDASVFPRIPGLFIVAAIYTMAEKASDVILEDAR